MLDIIDQVHGDTRPSFNWEASKDAELNTETELLLIKITWPSSISLGIDKRVGPA